MAKKKPQIQTTIYALDLIHNRRPVTFPRHMWARPEIGSSSQFERVSKSVHDLRIQELKQESPLGRRNR